MPQSLVLSYMTQSITLQMLLATAIRTEHEASFRHMHWAYIGALYQGLHIWLQNTIYHTADVAGNYNQNTTEGFVQTHGLGICRGCYAKALIKEWHRWDKVHASENDPVDAFPGDQLYVVFVVADGGADLEHFELRSFAEAQSILLQVTLTMCCDQRVGHACPGDQLIVIAIGADLKHFELQHLQRYTLFCCRRSFTV